jgi:hypothetical protein
VNIKANVNKIEPKKHGLVYGLVVVAGHGAINIPGFAVTPFNSIRKLLHANITEQTIKIRKYISCFILVLLRSLIDQTKAKKKAVAPQKQGVVIGLGIKQSFILNIVPSTL